jgi:hypothetical protein
VSRRQNTTSKLNIGQHALVIRNNLSTSVQLTVIRAASNVYVVCTGVPVKDEHHAFARRRRRGWATHVNVFANHCPKYSGAAFFQTTVDEFGRNVIVVRAFSVVWSWTVIHAVTVSSPFSRFYSG